MSVPYSLDLRRRIIGFVTRGGSRRGAASRFGVSASCAVKLVQRFERTGSASPGKRGGSVGKLAAHKEFLLDRVAAKRDITMPELAAALEAETGTKAAPASLSRLLIRHGLRFKKKHCRPPSRAAPTSPRSVTNGSGGDYLGCARSRTD